MVSSIVIEVNSLMSAVKVTRYSSLMKIVIVQNFQTLISPEFFLKEKGLRYQLSSILKQKKKLSKTQIFVPILIQLYWLSLLQRFPNPCSKHAKTTFKFWVKFPVQNPAGITFLWPRAPGLTPQPSAPAPGPIYFSMAPGPNILFRGPHVLKLLFHGPELSKLLFHGPVGRKHCLYFCIVNVSNFSIEGR